MLAACAKVGTSNESARHTNPWTHPGRFIYAQNQDVKSLNPMLATSASAGDLSAYLFSYAVRYDAKARPVPDALREIPTFQNGDVSRDGLTLTYKLRPNIYFHDGVQLTCRDLAFSWHAALNPANNNITHEGYRDIASIDCSDPLVAVIHMKRVYAPFLQQLWGVNGNVPILPAHLLQAVNDSKGSFNTAPFQSAPVGSGPFKFVRWDRGQQVVLSAFDRYFLGKPKLRTVIYRIVPDDSTLVAQTRTHEIDMAARLGNNVWPQARNIGGTVAIASPTFEFDHIDFNLHRPIFADVRVRRALETAIDRKAILDKVAHGNGDLSNTPVSPVLSDFYNPHVAQFTYDPAKARAALDAAGWKVGRDGIRVKNGQRFAFTYGTQTESVTGRAIEAFVQRAWHDVGAAVTVKNAPTAQFFANTTDGVLQGGNYDVAGFAWVAAADPDDSAIYSARNFAPHGQNAMYWNDPIATKAMDDGLATVDPAKRKAASWREQERFALDVPSIILYFRREPYVYNSDLKGFAPSPVILSFWDPQNYSI
ncbi:MAG: peptide ABC transporter substrate-binding protein [Candidatus Eremiobacteraeota bacterium]|nr:peptide ABC transporter substrate-binding protein [Candidatus Eremiobacteraeota bacterium]